MVPFTLLCWKHEGFFSDVYYENLVELQVKPTKSQSMLPSPNRTGFLGVFFCLHWVFIAARGLSLVAASGSYSSLWCAGFSTVVASHCGALALGARVSVVVARRLSSCGSRA